MIENVLFPFGLAFVCSFWGSLQPGVINVSVVATAREKGFQSAFWVGLGGSVPEIIYCVVAFASLEWLNQIKYFAFYFNLVAIAVFLFVIINIFRPKKNKPASEIKPINSHYLFWYGFVLAMLNPALLIFWLLTIHYFNEFGWLDLTLFSVRFSFSLGATLGAWFLMVLLARVVVQGKTSFFFNPK